MVGTAVDDHEARGLMEEFAQTILLRREPPFRHDAFRRLHDDRQHAARLAGLIDDGAVIQVHPDLLGNPLRYRVSSWSR